MFKGYLEASILGKSIEQGLNQVHLVNMRDFALDKHRSCDDAPYGGGAGMLLKPEPVARALDSVADRRRRIIYLSPSGTLLRQALAEELAREESLVLICGHYEGMDQRIIDLYVTDEVSVGDYVLFSGEVGAMVLMDAVARLEEGVIKPESLQEESFSRHLLEYPQYTRPAVFRGLQVPEVLISGHHEQIRLWRLRESLKKTQKMRPELLQGVQLTEEEKELLDSMGKEE
jgi:tRNA (guanine37-N1)-methyltransferase